MNSFFSRIYGNEQLKSIFSENINKGTLPHAFILEGGKGSGRYTFAQHIAASSLCTDVDPVCYICKNCRQVFDGIAPDVVTVSLPDDKATISVDAVRFIRSDAQAVPIEGELKFYIIRDSDRMTVQAQNALLKILEEPPSFVVFILISENSNLLLPTIRSRAPVFRMQRFGESELTEYILSHNVAAGKLCEREEQTFLRIIKSSGGSIGAVISSLEGETFVNDVKVTENVNGMLDALCAANKADFFEFEDVLSAKREEFKDFLCVLRSALRDILAVKKGSGVDLAFFDSAEIPKNLTKRMTVNSIIELLEITENTLSSNEINANINLLKINYMNALWRSVH